MITPSQEVEKSLDPQSERSYNVMLFDLSVGGHHPAYIQHLVRYWGKHQLPGQLNIVVLPKFLEQHQDVIELAHSFGDRGVKFVPISSAEAGTLSNRASFLKRKTRNLQEWKLFRKYADLLKPDECLFMYFDTFQLPTRFLGRNLPCPISGLYFRVRFHYGDFQPGAFSWKERFQQWLERNHIFGVVKHPQLKTLFCLDPFAVKYFDRVKKASKVVYLPDPVQLYTESELNPKTLGTELGVDPDRQIFLLFGVLDGRKGLHEILDAVLLLPTELSQKLCLLLVGPIRFDHKVRTKEQIQAITESTPAQVVVCDQFIPDRHVQSYFQISDVVLATYQRHLGTSSILIRAAAAGKPSLSTDYGLMGEWTRRHQLGITVDSAKPAEVAKGMAQFLRESPQTFCDRDKMQSFAADNSAEHYASVIFQNLSAK
ncbi:MAG: glycosyltransferase [Leptolyngbyaceae cyanobacterium RM2_2_4]|nr:glycosyltransferase [Leptolyngbyaceae cyanobacterium SM1_4_3]NJN89262.1 glycosyltransferase [Leptolyngbyaceae cyanobacterium SL_5_14]NJO49985.1 glycosyltransferase [Leptolyngbyaceae cyanobacterium RM2_2_4]